MAAHCDRWLSHMTSDWSCLWVENVTPALCWLSVKKYTRAFWTHQRHLFSINYGRLCSHSASTAMKYRVMARTLVTGTAFITVICDYASMVSFSASSKTLHWRSWTWLTICCSITLLSEWRFVLKKKCLFCVISAHVPCCSVFFLLETHVFRCHSLSTFIFHASGLPLKFRTAKLCRLGRQN